MPVLNGVLTTRPFGGSVNPSLVGALSDFAFEGPSRSVMPVLPGASLTGNYPVSAAPVALDGVQTPMYGEDFFQNFRFGMPTLEVGFVLSEITYEVTLCNRQGVPATLLSVDDVAGVGITFGMDPGTILDRYEQITVPVTLSPDGPGAIDATFTLTFSVGDPVVLRVRGFRATPWTITPQWSDGYRTAYAYKTESFVTRTGKEQRRALRHNPRFSSEFSVMLSGGNLSKFEMLMANRQNKPIAMPDFSTFAFLSSNATVGDTTIQVPSVSWLRSGISIYVSDGRSYELYAVDSVSGSSVDIRPSLANSFPEGSKVYLAYQGYIASGFQADLETDSTAVAKIRFEALPETTMPINPPAAGLTWNGREVFLKRPNWSTRPQVTFDYPVDKVDFDRGKSAYYRLVQFSQRTVQATFLGRTSAEVAEFKAFFDRMRGARGEFYAPTWKPDLVMATAAVAGSFSLIVKDLDAYNLMKGDTVYRNIAVVRNNDILYRRVSDMTINGANTSLTLTDSLPSITPDDVLMICWMPAWTLASDILTISWVTDSVATISLAMRTVEDLDV